MPLIFLEFGSFLCPLQMNYILKLKQSIKGRFLGAPFFLCGGARQCGIVKPLFSLAPYIYEYFLLIFSCDVATNFLIVVSFAWSGKPCTLHSVCTLHVIALIVAIAFPPPAWGMIICWNLRWNDYLLKSKKGMIIYWNLRGEWFNLRGNDYYFLKSKRGMIIISWNLRGEWFFSWNLGNREWLLLFEIWEGNDYCFLKSNRRITQTASVSSTRLTR